MALVSDSYRQNFFTLLILSCFGIASNLNAQESASDEHSTIEPSIDIELRHDDNIFQSATDEQSSLITTLSPGLLGIIVLSKHRFELQYVGEFAAYAQSSADNYDDHDFRAAANLELGRRSLLDLTGSYEDAHENRGSGLTEGLDPGSGPVLDQPDEYNQTQFGGRFTYGATGTKGRLVFAAGRRRLEYKNNRDRTEFFDYDDTYGSATFYFRVMPSTSLLLDVRANEFIIMSTAVLQPSLESTEYRYLLGATWDVTGKTTGTVKFGYVEKKYDDNARRKFSDASWEVDIRWSPRSYSHFDFATSRYPSEVTSLSGDVIDNTKYSIAWSHDWSPRVMTRLATIVCRPGFSWFYRGASAKAQRVWFYARLYDASLADLGIWRGCQLAG